MSAKTRGKLTIKKVTDSRGGFPRSSATHSSQIANWYASQHGRFVARFVKLSVVGYNCGKCWLAQRR